jgi:hypothetical protein
MPDDPMYTAALAVLDQDRVRRREINRRLINVAKRQLAAGMSTDEVWVTNFQCAIEASEMGAQDPIPESHGALISCLVTLIVDLAEGKDPSA